MILYKKLIAECIGTFALVFFGSGAIVINEEWHGIITHPGISLAFGLVVMIVIYVFGPISGAYINPAVSLAFALTHDLTRKEMILYIVAQSGGAITASAFLTYLFSANEFLGSTFPTIGITWSFLVELMLTYFLVLAILRISPSEKYQHLTGLLIGSIIFLEALFAGPLTGASMNPARSLGPAAISGHLEFLWIYLSAPFVGSWLAVKTDRFFGTTW